MNTETIELTAFEVLKKEILKRAKAADACQTGYRMAKNAKNEEELLQAIKENIRWCLNNNVVSGEYLEENFSTDLLHKNHIYTSGIHTVEGTACIVAFKNSSVVAWENSSVVAWENSSVVAWENSSVEACGNSSVEAWENSSVVARGNSSVEACGNSSVEAWENSSVVARGNSSVVAWENSVQYSFGEVRCAIVRDFAKQKVFVKTSDFEIVQVS